jgi:molybdopterin converting factor small subunit
MADKSVHIQYFAILREQRNAAEETVHTSASSPRRLYDDLRKEHAFSLDSDRLRVVINGEFADWDAPLSDGDRVVFIPPVAGG